jgi:hypothetical protein
VGADSQSCDALIHASGMAGDFLGKAGPYPHIRKPNILTSVNQIFEHLTRILVPARSPPDLRDDDLDKSERYFCERACLFPTTTRDKFAKDETCDFRITFSETSDF